MGSKGARRRVTRKATIETLESRQMFSVDGFGGTLGGSVEHHVIQEEPPLVMHSAPPLNHHDLDAPPLEMHDEPPSLVHHTEHVGDFWYDKGSERDIDQLLGDIEQTLNSAHDLTGWDQVRADYGFTGTGQTVAVIDSGIAYDHYALGGGLGSNYRVVGGWDFTENDANFYDDGPEGGHGTHVSGIVGGDRSGTKDDGVAPGVDLVGLRVFNDAGDGFFSWVESALTWVHSNRNSFENPITAVNLSLGTDWNSENIPSWAMLEDEFAQLEADGIFISVSAGNDFQTYNEPGLSYPAASPYVVPVMSVDDSGGLSYFSQRHTNAIAAPGRMITSTVPDYAGNNNGVTDDFSSWSGTSMAAPYVAGASVLIREAMEFVGYTDIDQWDIFDHMMNTADTFHDSATNLNYQRLNLEAAIDVLMPVDDYGSTVEDAYTMGWLGSTGDGEPIVGPSGTISKLSDVDYFQFTAGETGTVTFSADTTHEMAAAWSGNGSVTPEGDYTLDVVAGQTYTVGIATSDGLGHYDLAIDYEATFEFTDWGTIAQWQTSNLANSGETWYRVVASQDGYLTAEAFFTDASGDIDLAWFNSNLEQVASGVGATDSERVDHLVSVGEELFLRVTGTNGDVDFRCTNLVSLDGSTVDVSGTSGADTFSFVAGESHSVTVNGVSYEFDSVDVSTINFSGGAGSDTIVLTGSSGSDVARLRATQSTLSGSGYNVTSQGIEDIDAHGGGGYDRAYLYGTTLGNETYTAYRDYAVMTSTNYENSAYDFASTHGYSLGGADLARLYDTVNDDKFLTYEDQVIMAGVGYFNRALDFETAMGYASSGDDTARMYDSAGNDTYRTYSDRVILSGTGFFNYAANFDQTFGFASAGNDTARMYDSDGDDEYRAYPDRVVMSGSGYFNYAAGFENAYGYASDGDDTSRMYDSITGDDLYRAYFDYVVMSGNGYFNYARGFERNYGYSLGGDDIARLYDTAGDDLFRSFGNYSVMTGAGGTGYYNYAGGFNEVVGYASGGDDEARLYDSNLNDLAFARNWGTHLSSILNHREARGFDTISAIRSQGGFDQSDVSVSDYIFNLIGGWS